MIDYFVLIAYIATLLFGGFGAAMVSVAFQSDPLKKERINLTVEIRLVLLYWGVCAGVLGFGLSIAIAALHPGSPERAYVMGSSYFWDTAIFFMVVAVMLVLVWTLRRGLHYFREQQRLEGD